MPVPPIDRSIMCVGALGRWSRSVPTWVCLSGLWACSRSPRHAPPTHWNIFLIKNCNGVKGKRLARVRCLLRRVCNRLRSDHREWPRKTGVRALHRTLGVETTVPFPVLPCSGCTVRGVCGRCFSSVPLFTCQTQCNQQEDQCARTRAPLHWNADSGSCEKEA